MPATAESNAVKGATALKGRGNDDFRAGRFAEARKLYSEALQLVCPDGPEDDDLAPRDLVLALRSNSAECALRLNDWEGAHPFATAALQLDARHEKSQAPATRAIGTGYAEVGPRTATLHAGRIAPGGERHADAPPPRGVTARSCVVHQR